MTDRFLLLAARNNALWCEAVCAAHDRPGEFHEALWLNRFGTPRFYPDAVTLAGAVAAPTQMRALSALIDAPRDVGWFVKDSFYCLDLRALGCEILFDASWILSDPSAPAIPVPAGVRWVAIDHAVALTDWERVWRGAGSDEEIFRPPLLADPDVRIMALECCGAMIGGGILNRGADVVGLTNLFGIDVDLAAVWRGLAELAATLFPGLPVVAYDRDDDLAAAVRAGFTRIGPLRVWHRSK
jgi:hypothetical protein